MAYIFLYSLFGFIESPVPGRRRLLRDLGLARPSPADVARRFSREAPPAGGNGRSMVASDGRAHAAPPSPGGDRAMPTHPGREGRMRRGAALSLATGVHRPPFDESKPFAIARATRRRETLGPGASSRPLPTPLPSRRRGPRGGRRTPRGVVMGSVPSHELFVKWNETDTCVMESREFT